MAAFKSDGNSVRSVERAIAILQCFATDEELRLSQICERVDLPKSTAHRLISALEQEHMIEKDPETGKYFLGYEIIRLGQMARFNKAICRIVRPELESIAKQSGQTSNLYTIHGYDRLCVDQVEGNQYVRRYSYMGALHPLYCGASGKVLLAYSSEEFQRDFIENAPLQKITENTVCEPDAIRSFCAQIRKDGYAVSKGERDLYSGSVAVPIFSGDGAVIASITISGHVSIFSEENIVEYVSLLKQSADNLRAKF